ncbi:hypothetical protein GHYDROH2_26430 [Geobacter hydrogenophilus]|uniref:Uncharacterized protein n=1 Tax=Geobacter hydrogenophilus TaxID=40983 RepID=A0A9W6G2D3_9BACT|nr:hypothetical protein GHYDROH2_26430 [Geobacter hydrogenophilus]
MNSDRAIGWVPKLKKHEFLMELMLFQFNYLFSTRLAQRVRTVKEQGCRTCREEVCPIRYNLRRCDNRSTSREVLLYRH